MPRRTGQRKQRQEKANQSTTRTLSCRIRNGSVLDSPICRAPSFRLGPNISRFAANTLSTNSRLPGTSPSVNIAILKRHFRLRRRGNSASCSAEFRFHDGTDSVSAYRATFSSAAVARNQFWQSLSRTRRRDQLTLAQLSACGQDLRTFSFCAPRTS